ncbi:MAG: glycosyltransferase family 9 protein [Bdellovibrionales bacterium]|nr:glycosyltransferase family 9 protein [Bdellovibrionales bacterium]
MGYKGVAKLLIVRFSSLGDIVQCMSVAPLFRKAYPGADIHWVVREDLSTLLKHSPDVNRTHVLDRKSGLLGLIRLAFQLRKEGYTHIYDAHSNVRSHILSWIVHIPLVSSVLGQKFVRRSKQRVKRWLLFKHRKNLFPKPFRGAVSYLTPLKKWGLAQTPIAQTLNIHDTAYTNHLEKDLRNGVLIAPSAAWDNKRWPIEYWKELIALMPDYHFFILGGPEDHFCQDIADAAPERVTNLAGALSWSESALCIQKGLILISGDTGLYHIADLLGKPCVGLIGPSAFGYPSRSSSRVIEVKLNCKPCSKDGRDPCGHPRKKHCMTAISPEFVEQSLRKLLTSEANPT